MGNDSLARQLHTEHTTKEGVVSVIVPIYNLKNYLEKCISSIVQQTYRQLEIILIDDGSSDGSSEICDAWKLKDERIIVIRSPNSGVSHARNLGLSIATGQYVGFVDGDDWLDPDWFSRLVESLVTNKTDIAIGGYIKETPNGPLMKLVKGTPQILSNEETIAESFKLSKDKLFWWEMCDKLFRHSLFENIRFDERIYNCEDMLVCGQLFFRAENVSYVPLYGYHYFERENSATRGGLSKEKLESSILAKQILWKKARLTKNKKIINIISIFYFSNLIWHIRKMLQEPILNLESRNQIVKFQSILRRNYPNILFHEGYSLRVRLGCLYLMLPYFLVSLFKGIVN